MKYSIKEIQGIVGGKLIFYNSTQFINEAFIDTRTIGNTDNGLFFAIKSIKSDGHFFIPEAFKKGIRNFIISDEKFISDIADEITTTSSFLLVNDTMTALQLLAKYHREKYSGTVVGITGSNGKTIVKEWLFQLLGNELNVFRSPKSFNSQIGVPLSVFGMNDTHKMAILEAGISLPDEMNKLESVIQPDIGILTNIGTAHQEGFNTLWHKIREKLVLFKNAKALIYPLDNPEVNEVISELVNEKFFTFDIKFYNWSKMLHADLEIINVVKGNYKTIISGVYKEKPIIIKINFTDDASIDNAITCLLLLLVLDCDYKDIRDKFRNLIPVEMRLELKEGTNNCTLINDAYNSDINSLGIAIDFLNQQNQHNKKTVIFSDILQSGINKSDLYNKVSGILKSKNISRLIGIGNDIKEFEYLYDIEKSFYKSTSEFLSAIKSEQFNNEAILIKGARVFKFEKIVYALQKKIHATVLELNLQGIIQNLNVYKSFLKPETRVMAMVKAFSYGSGTYEVANILQYNHVDYLGVAYIDEGVGLREAGIKLPIMVMNPEADGFKNLFDNQLEPEIYTFELLEALLKYIHTQEEEEKEYPIHLKIDTGMHRLGFQNHELKEILNILHKNPVIKVISVFSHLASSENPADDDFTRQQIQSFRVACEFITSGLNYKPLYHILNSVGAYRFPEAVFDMVRLGLGLYGIDSAGVIQDKLENVSTLKTNISQIKEVQKGESVGYSRKTILQKDSLIAVIGIGYADGFHRALGNGKGSVWINEIEVPTVGDICMDMTTIDVTGLNVKVGDDVMIFGKEYPVQIMAQKLNTIPYEILTGISQRVKRVYYKE